MDNKNINQYNSTGYIDYNKAKQNITIKTISPTSKFYNCNLFLGEKIITPLQLLNAHNTYNETNINPQIEAFELAIESYTIKKESSLSLIPLIALMIKLKQHLNIPKSKKINL